MQSTRNSLNNESGGSGSNAAGTTMQLDFNTAMADFHTMFPDMDREVIEAVLRANQGAVDATIDQLLVMAVDNENEKSKRLVDGSAASTTLENASATEDIRSSQNVPRNAASADIDVTVGEPLSSTRGWDAIVLVGILPPDFLRLGSRRHQDVPDDAFLQYPSDAEEMSHITMLLQSPEFVEMIKKDHDFMLSLDKEPATEHSSFEGFDGKTATRPVDDDAIFRNRLARMGRASRRKLTQLARNFFRGTKFPMKNVTTLKDQSILCEDDEEWAAQSRLHESSHNK